MNGFSKVLSALVDCVTFPLGIVFLCNAFLALKRYRIKAIVLTLLLLVLLGWRAFVKDLSSRYFSVFLVAAVLFSSFLLYKNHSAYVKKFFWPCLAVYLVIQTICCFSSFRDSYILDALEEMNYTTSFGNTYSAILLPQKESVRLNTSKNNYVFIHEEVFDRKTTKPSQQMSLFYGLPTYLYITESQPDRDYVLLFSQSTIKPREIASMITNKRKSKRLITLKLDHKSDVIASETIVPEIGDNPIVNGDCEKIMSHKSQISKFDYWIKQGADFYQDETLKIPQHREIVLTRALIDANNYPKIYADDQIALNGNYSLHVEVTSSSGIYFFNRIKSVPGKLSFSIKKIDGNCDFDLIKLDYNSNLKVISSESRYKILLRDNLPHKIELSYGKEDFHGGAESLFYLRVSDSDFILDDISYFPD